MLSVHNHQDNTITNANCRTKSLVDLAVFSGSFLQATAADLCTSLVLRRETDGEHLLIREVSAIRPVLTEQRILDVNAMFSSGTGGLAGRRLRSVSHGDTVYAASCTIQNG